MEMEIANAYSDRHYNREAVRGKRKRRSPLLSLRNVIETRHLLPGRVRFRIPALVDNAEGKAELAEQIMKIQGVNSIEVNTVTGSVLIHHRDSIAPELLFAALVRVLGLQREVENAAQPIVSREIRELAQSLNRYVYEITGGIIDLWTAIPLILAGIGIYRWRIVPASRFPGGLTLMWWAYLSLVRKRPEGS